MPPVRPHVRYVNTEFLIEVARNRVKYHDVLHKFGRNPAVPNGSWELISNLSTTPVFLSAPSTVRIKAGGNAADDTGGAGAREITVMGLDDSLARAEEVIVTAGASASAATTTSFWRVDRAFVSGCGTYATPFNTAAITIEDSGGTTDLIQIAAQEAQTQYCAYAVAANVTAYLLSVDITVDGIQPADIRLFSRENLDDTTAPVAARRLRHYWDGVTSKAPYEPLAPNMAVRGPADIWMEALGSGGATQVTASFELLLVSDE